MRPGTKRCFLEGQRLTGEISLHIPDPTGEGGTTSVVYGSKGAGKSTFLLTLGQKIGYYDPERRKIIRETILWRGREIDYWLYFPKELCTLFIHKDDLPIANFRLETLEQVPADLLPPIITYTSCKDLYHKIKRNQINVIFEPSTYRMTDAVKKMIQKRGVAKREIFENIEVSPVIFWFEMFDWMVRNKDIEPMTIIFDEADELFPVSPAGARWYLNLWAKERIKDFRKKNLSLIMATHGYQDIDGRVLIKVNYKVYMRGCVTPTTSLVDRHAPILLQKEVYYIEKDAWGLAKFSRLPDHPKVTTTFGSTIGDEDHSGDDDDGGGAAGGRGGGMFDHDDATNGRKKRIVKRGPTKVINDRMKVDGRGRLVIDVSGLAPDTDEEEEEQMGDAMRPDSTGRKKYPDTSGPGFDEEPGPMDDEGDEPTG